MYAPGEPLAVRPFVGLFGVSHLVGSLAVNVHIVQTLHHVTGGCARRILTYGTKMTIYKIFGI